tara:strand:+ start:6201 stop:7073 length:873 start_codon:yes stop_codon:yes gene_type:complete
MAKKKAAAKAAPEVDVEQPEVKATNEMVEVVIEEPVVKAPVAKAKPKKPTWEIKDRYYFLKNGKSPVSHHLKSANIFWFDEEKGYERELKLTRNMRTVFVDEFPEGSTAQLDHIIFRNGALFVPKNKVILQKLLSLYHPAKDRIYAERQADVEAASDLDMLELQMNAMNLANQMDIDFAEAIMRVELGSKVTEMSSKELKRDLLLMARQNPSLFIDLATDDNIQLRNMGIKATEMGIIKLSRDNRTFSWASNDRKLMNVPFDEHPYSALAAWFKTDEGMEIFTALEKRLG